jgi:hypothetical protein
MQSSVVRFEVLAAVTMKSVMPRGLAEGYHHFGGMCCPQNIVSKHLSDYTVTSQKIIFTITLFRLNHISVGDRRLS